jgi:hypothetical protein
MTSRDVVLPCLDYKANPRQCHVQIFAIVVAAWGPCCFVAPIKFEVTSMEGALPSPWSVFKQSIEHGFVQIAILRFSVLTIQLIFGLCMGFET